MLNAAMASAPWLILEDSLKTIIAIAHREHNADAFKALMPTGGAPQKTRSVMLSNGTALVPVTGPIFRHANLMTELSGATSADMVRNEIIGLANDSSVKRIVLDIDSPGGQVNGIYELAATIREISKPIEAHISGTGASAAYWVASAADKITASKTALVGSIGAVLEIEVVKRDDVEEVVIVSSVSPDKRIDPTSEEGRGKLQGLVDDMGRIFVEAVADNRGISVDEVLSHYGKGAVFVADKAIAAGMIDAIDTLGAVLETASASQGGMTLSSTEVLRAKLKLEQEKYHD